MNVLILTTHLNRGGVARYAVNLAQGLCASGHRVWLASSGGEWENKICCPGMFFYRLPVATKSILSFKVFFSLARLLLFMVKNKIDMICANTRVTQFLAYLVQRCTGIPYVSVFHGFYRPSLERRLFKFEGIKTIAVSRAVREHCIRDLGIGSDNIEVVYNGIPNDMFAPRKAGLGEKVKTIGMLGRISAEKGHFLALDAFCLLRRTYPGLRFLIAGDGRLKEELLARIRDCALSDSVKIVSQEGEEFLDHIDVLLFPSSKEGFGFSILEAFAKKVCVVAYATGGIKEIVHDRQNGILFFQYTAEALADALNLVLTDATLRRNVIDNACAALRDYSLETMARNTLDVFKKAVQA